MKDVYLNALYAWQQSMPVVRSAAALFTAEGFSQKEKNPKHFKNKSHPRQALKH